MADPPWWQGRRGEWYVVAQAGLFALVVLGPRSGFGLPPWPAPVAQLSTAVGVILVLLGGILAVSGVMRLGTNLTVVPFPKEQATLVETGPYRLVRHPIYSGSILMALGWAGWVHGTLTIAYALALLVLFDAKSRREEEWLKAKFPDYAAYQKRVRKLIPFVY